ncbi:MAG: SIS domain-containing protein, partial [Nanoarchaeota archaeon]|nr:SIS domain-containing protein [Nanoarchaeota archaeon]
MKHQDLAYAQSMREILTTIQAQEMDAILQAAGLLADAVAQDGIVYTFGTGHSHVIAEDVAYRAGGLAVVEPVREPAGVPKGHVRRRAIDEVGCHGIS